ncbi:hypothetical protein LR48_Vigan1604s000100 [Vigna angularis]|uniref:Uncharacterized protein n=1 Tax=Phaseolus angularis TaxID=3914 RepID=A0A0L9TIN6_PHAAN|nr:hypothetical protein LR48_Vigan1604s000100 [Vigna angularis]
MATQLNQEQSQDSELPFQTVQIPDDDDSGINIEDGEKSHELTVAPPTFPSSYVPTLAPEESDEYFEKQAGISSNPEPGRPPSSSHTLAIIKEEEVSIPQFDYIDDYVVERYADDYIVVESDFNFPSMHDENQFLLSHPNVYSPCIEHESESVVDIACDFEIDSCSEDVSEVQSDKLGLGVIPLHVISLEPHCTNHVVGGTHEFNQHAPTVEGKGAYIHTSFNINRHQLNPLINNHFFLDPAVEDISLLDQIWVG